MILQNIKHHEGVRVGGNNINNLRHADETVSIVDSEGNHKISLQQSQSKGKKRTSTECKEDWVHGHLKTVKTFMYVTFSAKDKE